MNLTYWPFMKKMAIIFDLDINSMNFTMLTNIYDTLIVDKNLGRAIPKDLTDSDFVNLKHLNDWYYHFGNSHNLSKMYNTYKFNKIIA